MSRSTELRRESFASLDCLEDRLLPSGVPAELLDLNTATGSSYPRMLAVSGSRFFFQAEDGVHGLGLELWASDGTSSGTSLVRDIWPGATGGFTGATDEYLVNHNGSIYFRAQDGVH